MLAHSQGAVLNASRLARALGTSSQTVTRYIDVLSGLLLVRRLPSCLVNVGKRLVKSPKVYVRDSGLVHALLSIGDFGALSCCPVVGQSERIPAIWAPLALPRRSSICNARLRRKWRSNRRQPRARRAGICAFPG